MIVLILRIKEKEKKKGVFIMGKMYLRLETRNKESDKGEVQYKCPLCNTWELTWNVRTKIGVCWKCKKGYNEYSIKKIATTTPLLINVQVAAQSKNEKHPELYLVSIGEDNYKNFPDVMAFLMGNKNLNYDCIHKNIFVDNVNNRVAFYLKNTETKKCDAYMYRNVDIKKWRAAPGLVKSNYVYEAYLTTLSTPPLQIYTFNSLFLVEGCFDVLSLAQVGIRACGLLGTQLYENQEKYIINKLKEENLNLVIWMDPDKAGIECIQDIVKRFRFAYGIKATVIFAEKEPNDYTEEELKDFFSAQSDIPLLERTSIL
jgi:5S rRNA maturation endonuclease (ribonuclease M5)